MNVYSSIENLYASNGVQGKGIERGPEYGFSRPEFGLISKWLVTEKVDGTNIRVKYTNGRVEFAGRTDKANLPADLITNLQATFSPERFFEVFAHPESAEIERLIAPDVCLYGEGYGPGIQKAGQFYGGVKRFILFDVLVMSSAPADAEGNRRGWWLNWEDVVDVAGKLGIEHVPVLAYGASIEDVQALVAGRATRLLIDAFDHVEGVVCRTDPYLFDGRGRPLRFKSKIRDLREAG